MDLVLMSLFLLPYDGLKVMPSTYRPIIVYVLLINYFLYFIRKKIDKSELYYLIFIFYASILSLIIGILKGDSIFNAVSFIFPLLMGYIIFSVMNSFFKDSFSKNGIQVSTDILFTIIGNAYFLPLTIGVFESLSLIGILPIQVKEYINGFFGGIQESRICVTTTEASWVCMHLAFVIPIYIYLFKKYPNKLRYKIAICVSVLLFLYSQSLQGILTILVSLIVYLFISNWLSGDFSSFFRKFVIIAIIVFASLVVMKFFVSKADSSMYYIARLKYILDLETMAYQDGSTFVRLYNPIIALKIFENNFLFGVGGGRYEVYYGQYVETYYSWALRHNNVLQHIAKGNASSINLYFRVLAETGLIGGIIYFGFVDRIVKKIKYLRKINNKFFSIVLFWIIVNIITPVQFASFALVFFNIVLAYTNNISNNSKLTIR